MKTITVDGHTYSKDDLIAMRETVMGWYTASYDQWPEAINFTLTSSHLLAILHHVIEQYPSNESES